MVLCVSGCGSQQSGSHSASRWAEMACSHAVLCAGVMGHRWLPSMREQVNGPVVNARHS